MKTAALPLVSLIAASCAFGADTPPQNIRQDVARLTLLPGPHFTSPARPTSLTTLPPAAGQWHFVPASGPDASRSSSGAPASTPLPLAHPDTLRFEEKLPATNTRTPQTPRRATEDSAPAPAPRS